MAFGQNQHQINLSKAIKGSFLIELEINDTIKKMWSDDLIVFLEPQDATFEFVLDYSTLESDDMEVVQTIQNSHDVLRIQGRYRLDRIPLEKHPNKSFDVYGYVSSVDGNDVFKGSGNSFYLNNGYYESLYTMDLEMSLKQLGMNDVLNNTSTDAEVSIKHAIPTNHFE